MATRQSIEDLLQQCEDAIRNAHEQYQDHTRQEQYNDVEFTSAMQQIETAYNDVAKMAQSANGQQRDQLHRMRLQLQQIQNNMILHEH
ncbi:YtzC family protein [Robertmurraya massiliosenegalensis]|uniref:YtzC family protein n=1 Tax=Robertmurraya massiliosenegalensis TaxID=1287657 RepID=UPI0002D917F8|nr:YtzC family protein [Robertmurraya massiliosenegalensis]